MKKYSFLICFLLIAASALAQWGQYNRRLSADDQQRFDSYFQRWQQYKDTNNREQIVSMEKRMQDVMVRNNIPLNVPYEAIASNGRGGSFGRYRNTLSPDDQRRFDSYYDRWQSYRATNNRGETASMEKRMRDLMSQYRIPLNVSFDEIATNGRRDRSDDRDRDHWNDGDRDHDRDRWGDHGPSQNQGVYIVRARYGYGNQTLDVTDRVQGMVRNGRMEFRVGNDTLGTDPAPGRRKSLEIVYRYRGQEQRVRTDEGGVVRIP